MRIAAGDTRGRENISRYLIRAPFSVDKIRYCAHKGSVIYRTKMVKGPNRNFQVYDPLTFLAAVTSHIPNRGEHLVRYYSWYSSVQRGKRRKLGLEEPADITPIEEDGLSGKAARRALRMKRSCGRLMEILAGRHVHPITCVVGGFTKLPGGEELGEIDELLAGMWPDMEATVALVSELSFPAFERETEYVALLGDEGSYQLLGGEIGSSDGVRRPKEDYRSCTREKTVPHFTAKHASLSRESYAVGALARLNLKGAGLSPKAREAARELGLPRPCHNPYLNTVAQVVEMTHCLEDARILVARLREGGVDQGERMPPGTNEGGGIPVRRGEGVGAVEAPRGTLYHRYAVDGSGRIVEADCVIPTNQNLANIEADMRALVPSLLHLGEEEIGLAVEMLVRSYDPCISCATHLVELRVS